MELIRSSGIYKINNVQTGDFYIGSTYKFHKRFAYHRHYLRTNRHNNTYLQNAWNKYGEKSFKFEIVVLCDTNMLVLFEQKFLDYYSPKYNLCPQAKNCYGFKHSDKTKELWSRQRLGIKKSEKHKKAISLGRALTNKSWSSSGYKGVSFHAPSNRYRARIQIDGKPRYLGYFDTPELASKAYIDYRDEYYGVN